MSPFGCPWGASNLVESIDDYVASIQRSTIHDHEALDALHESAVFHLDFLEHHLASPLFPAGAPVAPFRADPAKRYVSSFIASARPSHKTIANESGVALAALHIHGAGGKPVMSQSALHGFHVFEGLQLRWVCGACAPRFGYTFRDVKVAKLVDGIIRLRFAVHLLQAAAAVAHLQFLDHPDGAPLAARYDSLARTDLPARREEAASQVRDALAAFVAVNRDELVAAARAPPGGPTFVYVRVEAQGGDRDAIGQGPVGVGQSTLQVLGQYASSSAGAASLVINGSGLPRMHSLAGPVRASALHELLSNRAVHHGNMGHQHVSAEMSLPHGSDMLLRTAETGADGGTLGPFLAETNFSNVAFVYGDTVKFPRSASATYGLMQHVLCDMVGRMVAADNAPVKRVLHEPIGFADFVDDLKAGRVSAACVLGSMPALRIVNAVTIDESLSGGPITRFCLEQENDLMVDIAQKFRDFVSESVVWEA